VRLCPTPNAMDSLYNSPMRSQAGPPPFMSSLFFRILHVISVFPHSRSIFLRLLFDAAAPHPVLWQFEGAHAARPTSAARPRSRAPC
jgi:hypothetical protein